MSSIGYPSPMQAVISDLLERGIGICVGGTLVAVIISNLNENQLDSSKKNSYQNRSRSLLSKKSYQTRSRSLFSGVIPEGNAAVVILDAYSSDEEDSPRLTRSLFSGAIPHGNAAVIMLDAYSSDGKDSPRPTMSLVSGVIPHGNAAVIILDTSSSNEDSPQPIANDEFCDTKSFDPTPPSSERGFDQQEMLLMRSPPSSERRFDLIEQEMLRLRSPPSSEKRFDQQEMFRMRSPPSSERRFELIEQEMLRMRSVPKRGKKIGLGYVVEVKSVSPPKTHVDDSFTALRTLFENKAKKANREELIEIGEMLFNLGEMLHAVGKREDAREVFERAYFMRTLAVKELMVCIAVTMRKQGLYHGDRGDDYLSVILVGAAELLQARPTPSCLKLCTLVQGGYIQQSDGKCPELQVLMEEMNEYINLVKAEAQPLADTLRAQINCTN